jgi:hypothetical protein
MHTREDRQCTRRKRPVVLFLVFPLPQEQKSDLRLFFRQRNVSTRRRSAALYKQRYPSLHLLFYFQQFAMLTPLSWPSFSLRPDISGEVRRFTAR